MKLKHAILTLACVGIVTLLAAYFRSHKEGASCTHVTLLDYPSVGKGNTDKPHGKGFWGLARLNLDYLGRLYATGTISHGGSLSGLTLMSSDDGAHWSIFDDFHPAGGAWLIGAEISPEGDLISFGGETGNPRLFQWVLRRPDATGHVQTFLNSSLEKEISAGEISSLFFHNHKMLVQGFESNSVEHNTYWVTRDASRPEGAWNLLERFSLTPGLPAFSCCFAGDQNGKLYSAGGAFGAPPGPQQPLEDHALIRESSDQGEHWKTLADLSRPNLILSRINDLKITNDGALLVSGYLNEGSNHKHWAVAESSDGGSSWHILDELTDLGFKASTATGLYIDAKGVIYAIGEATTNDQYSESPTADTHLIVRMSTDQGHRWSTAEDFQLKPGAATYPARRSISADYYGRVIVGMVAMDPKTEFHWIVHRLECH